MRETFGASYMCSKLNEHRLDNDSLLRDAKTMETNSMMTMDNQSTSNENHTKKKTYENNETNERYFLR